MDFVYYLFELIQSMVYCQVTAYSGEEPNWPCSRFGAHEMLRHLVPVFLRDAAFYTSLLDFIQPFLY